MKSAVVILNWNGKGFLQKYLPVLLEYTPPEYGEVIVADNGSTDGSVEFLKKEYPDTRLIAFDKNYGFTGGYNRAFKEIDAEYYILINSDIRVTDGWIEHLIDFMDSHPDAGICMPKILSEAEPRKFEYAGACGGFIDRYGYPFCRGRILSEIEEDNGQYDTPMEIFWASGACMAVRSSIYKQLYGLDELFFAHMEEIDFCWRAKLMGYHVWSVPQSMVYHVGGGALPNDSPFKLYLNYRNNLLMLYKNLPEKDLKQVMRIRFWLDYLAAIRFLLGGNFSNARAVHEARRAFHKLKPAYASARQENLAQTRVTAIPELRRKSLLFSFYLKRQKTFAALQANR